jgi:hypothetical protein
MSLLKIIGARRRNGRVPTLAPRQWDLEQKKRADAGCCIECGRPDPGTHSFLCVECQEKSTMKEIREEIALLRRQLLKRP